MVLQADLFQSFCGSSLLHVLRAFHGSSLSLGRRTSDTEIVTDDFIIPFVVIVNLTIGILLIETNIVGSRLNINDPGKSPFIVVIRANDRFTSVRSNLFDFAIILSIEQLGNNSFISIVGDTVGSKRDLVITSKFRICSREEEIMGLVFSENKGGSKADKDGRKERKLECFLVSTLHSC